MKKKLYAVTLIFYTLLFLVPLLFVLKEAKVAGFRDILSSEYYRSIIGFTFKQAFISTLISVAVGLPGAYIMANINFKLKKTVSVIYYIPFILPSILVVLGFVIAYGNNGFLNKLLGTDIKILYSFKAVILAHVFYNFPVAVSIISNKIASIDNSIAESAMLDGASEFIIFKRITLPRIISSIVSSLILIFIFCFSSFAVILVLGGGPRLSTIEVEIYRLSRLNLDFGKAGALAMISLVTVILTTLVYNHSNRETGVQEETSRKETELSEKKTSVRFFTVLYLALTGMFLFLPLLGIAIKAFAGITAISLKPVLNTMFIAVLSSFLSLFFGYCLCIKLKYSTFKLRESLMIIPMATSSIILGLGYYMVERYTKFIPELPLLIFCHGVINTPFATETILPVYKSLPESTVQAAQLDGACDFSIIKNIELPYLKNTLINAFVFCFTLSCGELNSSIMVSKGSFATIPLQIQELIRTYNYEGACAAGTVMLVMCVLVFVLGQRLKDR